MVEHSNITTTVHTVITVKLAQTYQPLRALQKWQALRHRGLPLSLGSSVAVVTIHPTYRRSATLLTASGQYRL